MSLNEERIDIYLDSLMEDMPERLEKLEEKAKGDGVPIIRKQTRAVIRFFIKKNRPGRVLEIGTAVGFSALYMMEYLDENSLITTIEKVPDRIRAAKENFNESGYGGRIELLEGDAEKILFDLKNEKQSYDFVFMDAAKGQYNAFLEPVLCMLKPGGILISDNVLQEKSLLKSRYAVTRRDRTIHERMREYLYTLTHYEGLETIVIPTGDGVAVSVWTEKKEQ